MATFNWSPNPYFTPTAYRSDLGSDANDGTANAPYRTFQKCKDMGKIAVQSAPSVNREDISFNSLTIFGEPGFVFDRYIKSSSLCIGAIYSYNVKFRNFSSATANNITIYRSFYDNCLVKGSAYGSSLISMTESILKKSTISISHTTGFTSKCDKNTFVNSNVYIVPSTLSINSIRENIFFGSKIEIVSSLDAIAFQTIAYCLFFDCQFKFGSDAYKTQVQLETETGLTGIDAIRKAHQTKFGGSVDTFQMCKVADPLFNNVNLDDYTLHPLSPARHMAYDGTYIGAKDVGFPTFAYTNDLGYPNAFYIASKHANIIVGNNSITLARNPDGNAVGSGYITEKPKNLGQIYELKGNGSSYMGADRNREMLDVNSDIGDMASPISAGTPLTSGVIYINEGGSVVYNGTTHANRSRITAVDSVQSFTTTEGAVLHAVTEYPNRYTNLIRHKQTIPGTQIAAGTDVLTADSWYRVLTSSITWDGKTIPVDDCFQAVAGKLTFTGTGVCVAEFSAADVWSECIIDAPIKCRRVGNVASGAIDVGTDGKPITNGHKEYYNATNKVRAEFSIFAAYVQKHWVLNAKMSK